MRALLAALAVVACGGESRELFDAAPPLAPPPERPGEGRVHANEEDALAELLAFEEARRQAADWSALPRADDRLGPDPYDLAGIPGSDRLVGLLRGASRVVLLDRDAGELARLPAPASPTGLAITERGDILVAGETTGELAHYRPVRVGPRVVGLRRAGTLALEGVFGVRDLAARDGHLYLARGPLGRLEIGELERDESGRLRIASRHDAGACGGAIQTRLVGDHWIASCLLDHAVVIYRLDAGGRPRGRPVRIEHDGPIWSFDVAREEGALLLAAGGVEDRPLEREDGAFGYIDSYAYLYRIEGGAARRLAAFNLSARGAVTPKVLDLDVSERGVSLTAVGYGGDRAVTLRWISPALAGDPEIEEVPFPPGANRSVRIGDRRILADPLLDAWVLLEGGRWRAVPVAGEGGRSIESRVGEALFFGGLMAPGSPTEGKSSRFTCETCHFEGTVDGRTHFTGRGEVYATTKPLLSLLSNRPYFSRALDPTMAKMVHNEFRVANKGNRDPWFDLEAARFPYLALFEDVPETLDPQFLRRSLMTFLMDFNHRPNPFAMAAGSFGERERAGAEEFRRRCEACHQARLVADEPKSRLSPAAWEPRIFEPAGAIAWAKAEYEKTGIEPYVHERGARVPSLRRLYLKRPYFTDGSAEDLAAVLERAAWRGERFFHGGAPPGSERLDREARASLLAFLRLL